MLTIIKICLHITTSDLEKVTLQMLHNDPEDDFHRTRLLMFSELFKNWTHSVFKKDLCSLHKAYVYMSLSMPFLVAICFFSSCLDVFLRAFQR